MDLPVANSPAPQPKRRSPNNLHPPLEPQEQLTEEVSLEQGWASAPAQAEAGSLGFVGLGIG